MMRKKLIIAVGVSLSLSAGFTAANAAVLMSSTDYGYTTTGSDTITFDSPTPAGFSVSGGSIRNYSDGMGAEPAIADGVRDSSNHLTANAANPAKITASKGYRDLSFYWGSMDNYHTVTLLAKDGSTIGSYIGGAVYQPANGNQGGASTNREVTYATTGSTPAIYGVQFSSTQPAFEVDNVRFSSAVPESATWLMMILGFGAIGGVMRRAHRKSAENFTQHVRLLATA